MLFLELGRPRRGVRAIGSPEMQAAQAFGSQLFATVFTGPVQSALVSSLALARQQGQGLRIRLRLGEAPALADLPWEFLYDPTYHHFLAYSTVTPLVRYLDLPHTVAPLAVQPPLKVLVMIANPRDHGYATIDVEDEWLKVQGALAGLAARGLVQVTRLEAATLSALQHQLRHDQYHIFHFVGHGGFDQQTQSGVLLLEDEQGRSRMVSGPYLGALLRDHFSLRLALLNACEGARTSRADPFAGVAQHLVQQGIPAVIAMQFEITDQAAITLSHEFYNALADNYGVDAALAEARKALYATGNDIEWGTPVLYMRAQSGQLFDLSVLGEVQLPLGRNDEVSDLPLLEQPTEQRSRDTGPEVYDEKHVANEVKTIFQADENKSSQVVQQLVKKRKWRGIALAILGLTVAIYLAINWSNSRPPAAADIAFSRPPSDAALGALWRNQGAFDFVYIPEGVFTMGSDDGAEDERPVHEMSESAFWIMQTEVTNAQYAAFIDEGGYQEKSYWTEAGWSWRNTNDITYPQYWYDWSYLYNWSFNDANQPVVGVSWYEAMAYTSWLSEKTNLTVTLPTESQWEKAARGTEAFMYPWGNDWIDGYANVAGSGDGYEYTAPVGSYKSGASPYGVLDMAGNAWEWTATKWLENYENYAILVDKSSEGDARRVVRGGSWYFFPNEVRTTDRSRFTPDIRTLFIGFRIVAEVAP